MGRPHSTNHHEVTMFTGRKVLGGSMLAVAVLLSTQVPADAQPPQKKGEAESVAALEAQLALLKKMTAEVEEKLKDARAAEKKRGRDGFNPFGGFPGKKGFGERFGKGEFKGKIGEKGPWGKKQHEKEKNTDRAIEERLERLTKEIEEIRKSLKK
jgi:hypothetical protein